MKLKIKMLSIIFVILIMFLGVAGAQAQEEDLQQYNEGSIVVADVSVWNAELLEQNGGKMMLSFDINNASHAQPNVTYAVIVTEDAQEEFEGEVFTYQKVVAEEYYDDKETLSADETITKIITYQAPEYLKGEYMVNIHVYASGGLIIGFSDIGKVEFGGTGEYVEIFDETCYLQVKGEEK